MMDQNNCLLVIDGIDEFDCELRFIEDNSIHVCCDEHQIHLLCQYDPTLGIILNGKVIFDNTEFVRFYRENVSFESEKFDIVNPNECDDSDFYYYFLKNNVEVEWYYLSCISFPELSQKDIDSEHVVLTKSTKISLHKDGKEYSISLKNADIHVYISINYSIKPAKN